MGVSVVHKRGSNEAYEASEGHPERIRMDGRKIRLPKVGWVIMAESLPDHDGCRPLQVHVRRDAGRWFVSIVVRLRHGPSRTVRQGVDGRG